MNVLILGGGPAGCAAAYQLRQRGVTDITLVEREPTLGGCARTQLYENIPYEFGPQIMYTDEDRLRAVFEQFLQQTPPPTSDHEYHPAVSVDGMLDDPHDFPVTVANVLKLPDPAQAIYELYRLNLDRPDYSSFENYIISRMGRTLYETYIKNYNIKQWKIHPDQMDAEWARFRALTLREKPDMFMGKWQGHPGNYNPMWDGMTRGVKRVRGEAAVSEDFQRVTVDGSPVEADLVISTLPLSRELDFINTCIIYVVLRSDEVVMPSYTTSFPNNHSFVRVIEYRQQYRVDSESTLLDFEFPWVGECEEARYHEEVDAFCRDVLHRDVVARWVWNKEQVYPVSTRKGIDRVKLQLDRAAASRVVPMGRSGVHAYCSKDTCIRMAMIVAQNLDALSNCNVERKRAVFEQLREKLT